MFSIAGTIGMLPRLCSSQARLIRPIMSVMFSVDWAMKLPTLLCSRLHSYLGGDVLHLLDRRHDLLAPLPLFPGGGGNLPDHSVICSMATRIIWLPCACSMVARAMLFTWSSPPESRPLSC